MVYQMYCQGRMLIDEYLEAQGKAVTGKNRQEAMDEVDKAGDDLVSDPTIFVAQLESWRLYEDYSTQSFVPTYYQGWSPKHIVAKDAAGNTYEFDADTNARQGQYLYIPEKESNEVLDTNKAK